MRGSLRWYAARLAAMSPAEILHRVFELGSKRRLARVEGWGAFENGGDIPVCDLPMLRRRLADASAFMLDDVLKNASFLGLERPSPFHRDRAPEAAAWFADPVSGREWPGAQVSAFSVDLRSTSSRPREGRPFGDVKFVWEPNRLQILHPLAAIAAGQGREGAEAGALGLAILRGWMQANPPYRGVNWTSGIELALRLVSATLLAAAVDLRSAPEDDRRALSAFVRAHAHMLERLPSLHSSANNHRIAEGLGLYLAGALCPDLQRQKRHGREILETETLLQIHADGVGAEQSPTYQAFAMELVAFAALMGQDEGAPFARATLERLDAGADFLRALQSRSGGVPSIGDDDEGRAILAPHIDEPLYVASVANAIAGLTGGGDREGVRPGYLRETLFRAPAGESRLPRSDFLHTFADGGYTVARRRLGGREMRLVFDHGPLGYLSLAAHGHADALAIWLDVDGAPVFVDAGTWLYHSGESVRAELRRSQSHNTLSLEGLSQSEPSAAFSWANKAQARACAPDPAIVGSGCSFSMAGEHDGYLKRAGVVHRRDIAGGADGFVIADRLIGAKEEKPVSLLFLCHSSIGTGRDGEAILLFRRDRPEDALLRLSPPAGFAAELYDGVDASLRYSPRFGDLRDTAGILLKGSLAEQPCLTVIQIGTEQANEPG